MQIFLKGAQRLFDTRVLYQYGAGKAALAGNLLAGELPPRSHYPRNGS